MVIVRLTFSPSSGIGVSPSSIKGKEGAWRLLASVGIQWLECSQASPISKVGAGVTSPA